VALAVKQRLAASLVGRDDARARAILDELQGQTTRALKDLRDLARGVYPQLLTDRRLAAAIEAQARKAAFPVRVETDSVGRFPPEVEATVYFCALEALSNAAKYADATHVIVRLDDSPGELCFEVNDDGVGFDPVRARGGTGLQGMADRLAAIGGQIEIRSTTGDGTTVIGRIPVEATP
jgi:signal transduction histidine kinase